MRRIVGMILYCAATLAMAQSSADFSSKKANLEALERMWNEVQVRKDASAISGMISDRFIDTEFDGEVRDRGRFLADFKNPKFDPTMMDIGNVEVFLYGTTAVVVGNYHIKGLFKGKPYEHFGRFTDTWVFLSDKWACVASHSSLKK